MSGRNNLDETKVSPSFFNENSIDPVTDIGQEKLIYYTTETSQPQYSGSGQVTADDEIKDKYTDSTDLKKDLKARHVSMIAIGGALGTGLLIGVSSALSTAGPASIFIAYSLVGAIVFLIMAALGEMATFIPLPEGFSGYGSRYVDEALGFSVGYCYLIKYLIITPNQLTAASLVIQYWINRDKVNPGVWITIFLVVIVTINIFGVKFFGEFEFWLSSFKVITIVGLILLLFILMLGGGPTHDRLGFRYWKHPGAFKPYSELIDGDTGKFVAWAAVLVTAVFAFLGIELVSIVSAEAGNPRHSIPKAVKLTFYRIVFFYILSVLLVGTCVAYNDPLLLSAKKAGTSASASPFVIAIVNAKIPALPHIINACILIFIFSASNSDLYIASRTLYGLSRNGKAPKIFSRTKRGVPIYSLAFCSLFCLLAYMNVSAGSGKIFTYFVNVVSIFGLVTWITILISHIFFMKALAKQGIDRTKLNYYAPFQPYGSYIALALCIIISLIKNFTVFLKRPAGVAFDYKTFITGYIGLPVYVILYFGYKLYKKTNIRKPEEVDLVTYKAEIDEEEEAYLQSEAEIKNLRSINGNKKDSYWFYKTFLSWLF